MDWRRESDKEVAQLSEQFIDPETEHLNDITDELDERIASLERTVGEQADQIGGLTSELEMANRQCYELRERLGTWNDCKAQSDAVDRANERARQVEQQLAASQAELERLKQQRGGQMSADWETEFDKTFVIDTSGERVDGYLLKNTGAWVPGDDTEYCTIARPEHVKEFIRTQLAASQAEVERVQALEISVTCVKPLVSGLLGYANSYGAHSRDNVLGCKPAFSVEQVHTAAAALAALDAATGEETSAVEEVKGDGAHES